MENDMATMPVRAKLRVLAALAAAPCAKPLPAPEVA
jgi:hypothetical protein